MINCIINFKLWYTSHVYPLTFKYANKIKRLTVHYMWGKKWEPIKRTTLALSKQKGGLGIMDIYYKSRSILASSFLKSCLNEVGIQYMVDYFNSIRTNQLLNRTSELVYASYVGTEYYRKAISIVQKCTHMTRFPHIIAKTIYENILIELTPTIESHYGLCNWKLVWSSNLCSVLILSNERETLFRYLHENLQQKRD